MIIFVIYNVGIAIFKTERDPPVCLNRHSPRIVPGSLQFVQF